MTAPTKQSACHVTGILAIVFGALGFIPVVGRLFLIASIVLGIIAIAKRKKKAICGIIGLVLGLVALILKIITMVALFSMGGQIMEMAMDELPPVIAQEQLPQTVKYLEDYKAEYGEYPELLADLDKLGDNAFAATIDPMGTKDIIAKAFAGEFSEDMDEEAALELMPQYYYERLDDGYYLFSNGADQMPFTEDDIMPDMARIQSDRGLKLPN